jgi:hypothetical protein
VATPNAAKSNTRWRLRAAGEVQEWCGTMDGSLAGDGAALRAAGITGEELTNCAGTCGERGIAAGLAVAPLIAAGPAGPAEAARLPFLGTGFGEGGGSSDSNNPISSKSDDELGRAPGPASDELPRG